MQNSEQFPTKDLRVWKGNLITARHIIDGAFYFFCVPLVEIPLLGLAQESAPPRLHLMLVHFHYNPSSLV